MRNKKKLLLIELVPKTCHFSNVRTTVSKKDWDKIRFISYELANNKCEICGDTGKKQGYSHNVECHEVWEYDDVNKTQKLIGLISLCPTCHQVKHFGRAIAIGKEKQAYSQLAKVNKWKEDEIDNHILESFQTYKERSKHEWKLDITLLTKEPYNIKLKPIKKRIFENKPVKKRKKRKRKTTNKKGV
jgi:hypothetical protein